MSDSSENAPGTLAVFVRRVAAYFVDCVVVFAVVASTQWFILTPLRQFLGFNQEWFLSGWNTQVYTLLTISIPVWLYFALLESSRSQASIGKMILKLKVLDANDGGRCSFGQTFTRTILKLLPWELAHLGNNLPVPLWYSEEPEFRIAFAFSGIVMGLLILPLALGKTMTIHDRITHTSVLPKQTKNII